MWFSFRYEECGYGEPNGELMIGAFGRHLVIKSPFKSKRFPYGDCDAPQYGIQIYDGTLTLMLGGNGNDNGGSKRKSWDLPFVTYRFHKHLVRAKDGSWIDYRNDTNNVGYMDWYNIERTKSYDAQTWFGEWVDSYDGEIIPAMYREEIRTWRPTWLGWTRLFEKEKHNIDVCFRHEVGSGKGSWKGGVMGAGHDMKPGETPEECFTRMNLEKQW